MFGFLRLSFFSLATLVGFAASAQPLQTVPHVDLAQYAGTWYQIARNPLIFEWGCVCSTQVLTPRTDGKIDVANTCRFLKPDGRLVGISGEATVADTQSNAKLEVDFHLPWKGQYWIIALDPQYRYAVVSDPSRQSLYVLSRTPQLDPDLYAQALQEASAQTSTSKLKLTLQTGCPSI